MCDDVEIPRKNCLVYLGVTLGEGCSLTQHIKSAARKAEEKVAALSRLTPNIKGPGSKKREMLYSVVQSILLYGAPIWYEYMRFKKHRELLTRVQRRMLLRVISAYRTASAKAVQVVSGIIPIDLLAEERWRLYKRMEGNNSQAKREERTTTLNKWQEIWDHTEDVAL
ncbi:hypothetical protein JTB14_037221 [Gonioctena quinquepunctata]|nr:hypothetical protein JTB14_037221 [Gonioctena quinquepunctata]